MAAAITGRLWSGSGRANPPAAAHPVRRAGGETMLELRVPAEELPESDARLVGRIEVGHGFR